MEEENRGGRVPANYYEEFFATLSEALKSGELIEVTLPDSKQGTTAIHKDELEEYLKKGYVVCQPSA